MVTIEQALRWLANFGKWAGSPHRFTSPHSSLPNSLAYFTGVALLSVLLCLPTGLVWHFERAGRRHLDWFSARSPSAFEHLSVRAPEFLRKTQEMIDTLARPWHQSSAKVNGPHDAVDIVDVSELEKCEQKRIHLGQDGQIDILPFCI